MCLEAAWWAFPVAAPSLQCKDLQSPRGTVKYMGTFACSHTFSSSGDQTTEETVLPQVPSANPGLIQKKMYKEVLENPGSFVDQKELEQPFMYVTFLLQILIYFQVFSS